MIKTPEFKLAITQDNLIRYIIPTECDDLQGASWESVTVKWMSSEEVKHEEETGEGIDWQARSVFCFLAGVQDWQSGYNIYSSDIIPHNVCLRGSDGLVLVKGFIDWADNDGEIMAFLFPDCTLHLYQGDKLLAGEGADLVYQIDPEVYDTWRQKHNSKMRAVGQSVYDRCMRMGAYGVNNDSIHLFWGDNNHPDDVVYTEMLFTLNEVTGLLELTKFDSQQALIDKCEAQVRHCEFELEQAQQELEKLKRNAE